MRPALSTAQIFLPQLANGQVKLLCEFKIALVVRWHSHDRACPVGAEDIVGDVDRDFFFGRGITSRNPFELHARFLFIF